MRDSSAGTYFFNEKTVCVYKWETNYCLLLFSDMIIKTNYFFIFRDLLKFTMKCIIGYHIKAFSFLFCTASEVKSIKGGEHEYTEWLQNNEQKKKKTYLVCLHAVTKYEKVESINTQNDYKATSKNWTDKKKTNTFCVVCKSLNSKKTNSRLSTKEFLGNNNDS